MKSINKYKNKSQEIGAYLKAIILKLGGEIYISQEDIKKSEQNCLIKTEDFRDGKTLRTLNKYNFLSNRKIGE